MIIERDLPSGQQRPARAGNVHRCAEPREDGPGNPLGYCTGHLNAMAGEQEDWENDEEYGRRRRMLCPYQLGANWAVEHWCPEPSDPDSEDGFCVVHNPAYDPESPEYDEEAAVSAAGESVPCLMCDGTRPGCPMCGGRGRMTLETANQYRAGTRELPDDQDEVDQELDRINREYGAAYDAHQERTARLRAGLPAQSEADADLGLTYDLTVEDGEDGQEDGEQGQDDGGDSIAVLNTPVRCPACRGAGCSACDEGMVPAWAAADVVALTGEASTVAGAQEIPAGRAQAQLQDAEAAVSLGAEAPVLDSKVSLHRVLFPWAFRKTRLRRTARRARLAQMQKIPAGRAR